MIVFLLILLVLGLICILISRRFKSSIERMDAEYTGDVLPDKEADASFHHERRIKYRIMKSSWYISMLFFAYLAAFLIFSVLSLII
jgi:hypothetical protein